MYSSSSNGKMNNNNNNKIKRGKDVPLACPRERGHHDKTKAKAEGGCVNEF